MSSDLAYCVARVIWPTPEDEENPFREETARLDSFEFVVAHLKRTYDQFADFVADRRAAGGWPDDPVPIGGLGVRLTNRFGGVAEVGVGRRLWAFWRLVPEPIACYSDRPTLDGMLAFYLDGWHHTELDPAALVTREICLDALREWLESGRFPDNS